MRASNAEGTGPWSASGTGSTGDTPPPSNNAPTFTEEGEDPTRSVPENSPIGTNVGSAVEASDSDGDTLTYSLEGTDAASFSIGSDDGQLKTNAALDFESKNSYSVTVTVSDPNGGSDTIAVTVTVTNLSPTITSGPFFSELRREWNELGGGLRRL